MKTYFIIFHFTYLKSKETNNKIKKREVPIMKNFKNELGDTNPERTTDHLEKEITEDTIEGYAYCATTKQKCLKS